MVVRNLTLLGVKHMYLAFQRVDKEALNTIYCNNFMGYDRVRMRSLATISASLQ